MEEIFTPSLCFFLSFIISLTASLIVNLSLEFHTFPKCVFPLCLISSKPSVTQQICNELALCQGKKKKWHHFPKGGDQSFNLSETEKRTKEISGRTKRGKRRGWSNLFLSPSMLCTQCFRNLESICFPFSSNPAGHARSCLDIISEKRVQRFFLPTSMSLVGWGEGGLFKGLCRVSTCMQHLKILI